jgi:site-specific DNA-methyltransferase (adenine-specific)
MSIAIACHDLAFDLDVCELDKDYFEAAKKRLEDYQAQMQFNFTEAKQ